MTQLRFSGVVKPMRRGGWSARGLIESGRHGQLIDTQIGPIEFAAKEVATEWLRQIAAERSIDLVQIETKSECTERTLPAPLGSVTQTSSGLSSAPARRRRYPGVSKVAASG